VRPQRRYAHPHRVLSCTATRAARECRDVPLTKIFSVLFDRYLERFGRDTRTAQRRGYRDIPRTAATVVLPRRLPEFETEAADQT